MKYKYHTSNTLPENMKYWLNNLNLGDLPMLFTPQKVSLFQVAVPEKFHYFQISFLTKHTDFLGMITNSVLNFAVFPPLLFK